MSRAKLGGYLLVGAVLTAANGSLGRAQIGANPAFSCIENIQPSVIRKEGAAELVSDIYLVCTGGTPYPAGSAILPSTIEVVPNTKIANRVFNGNLSDALLIIDDAYPSNPNPSSALRNPLAGSPQDLCQTGPDGCPMTATGNPSGNPGGDYDGTGGHYNVFEGFYAGGNAVVFSVPLDPPGPSGSLTIRITNIRVDVTQLVELLPIQTFISIFGGLAPAISNAEPVVANAMTGFNFAQTPPTPIPGTSYTTFSATFTEGFPAAFKTWIDYQSIGPENVPGFPYNTESGLWDKLMAPAGIPAFGLANHGTRLMLHFSGYPAGVKIVAPSAAYLGGDTSSGIQATGAVMYVATDANGNSTDGPKASGSKVVEIATDSQGSGWLTYEVMGCNPSITESVKIPLIVESPTTGTVTGGLAPLVSSSATPIPRFVAE